MVERLVELMRIRNLTSSQLADAIGVQRSGISHLISGRNKPSLEFILKILTSFPEVNPDWMLFGKEPFLRNESRETKDSDRKITDSTDVQEFPARELSPEQPSLLEELFNEPPIHDKVAEKEVEKPVKKQDLRSQHARIKDPGILKNDKTGAGSGFSEPANNDSPEKIFLLYKNRKFREYLPE